MKAAVIERPGILAVREVPLPPMGDYDALCEILYGATCSGTDHHLLAGRFPWPVQYPTVLGHESIGRVIRIGPRVRYLKAGDLVTRVGTLPTEGLSVNWGGFAEYGIARDHRAMREDGQPPEEWSSFRINQVLPPGTDPAGATMVITWRETLSYITRLGVKPGARVLVLGSGGNGLAFTAHARNLGAGYVATVGNSSREGIARAAGATAYLDYRAEDLAALLAQAQPEGFDVIIDAVGKAGQIDRVLPALKPGGTTGIYGIDDYGACTINPTRARGTFTYYNGGYDEEETHEQVISFWQQGLLRPELWLDLQHPFSLAEIHQALAAVHERKIVKALVRIMG